MDLTLLLMAILSWAMEFTCAEYTVVDYTGYQVYRVRPSSASAKNILWRQIEDSRLGLDLWADYPLRGEIDVLVPPISKTKFQALLSSLSTSYNITVNDIQRLIEIERASMHSPSPRHARRRRRRRRRQSTSDDLTHSGDNGPLVRSPRLTNELPLPELSDEAVFYDQTIVGRIANLTEINRWLGAAEALFPDLVNVSTYGVSYEGRPLKYVKIASPSPDGVPKRAILIDAASHPREWITPPTVAYIMLQVLNLWREETEMARLIREYDWYLVPVANVDGFEFTRGDRFWRKTRSQNPYDADCIGVDMNRNFGFHWRNDSRRRPCSTIFYAGHSPSSEPEVRALADLMLSLQGRLHVYLNLHAPLEMWLTPWAWTRDQPDDYDDIMSAGNVSAMAILQVHGINFPVGSPAALFHKVGGTAMDFAKGVAGAKFSFAPELRRTEGVLIQNITSIRYCGEETWAGVEALLLEIRRQDIRDGVVLTTTSTTTTEAIPDEPVIDTEPVERIHHSQDNIGPGFLDTRASDAAAAIIDFLHHQEAGLGAGRVDFRSRQGVQNTPDIADPDLPRTVTEAAENEELPNVEPGLLELSNATTLADTAAGDNIENG